MFLVNTYLSIYYGEHEAAITKKWFWKKVFLPKFKVRKKFIKINKWEGDI